MYIVIHRVDEEDDEEAAYSLLVFEDYTERVLLGKKSYDSIILAEEAINRIKTLGVEAEFPKGE